MKTVALNALRLVATRDGEQLRHARHGVVKRRVEAGNLRRLGKLRGEVFHQRDGGREMVRGKGTDAPQFLQHCLINPLGLAITRAAMHDAITDGVDGAVVGIFLQQLHQQRNAGNVVGRVNLALVLLVRADVSERQPGVGQSDALELAGQNLRERFVRLEQRESKARRAAVDRQYRKRLAACLHGFGVGGKLRRAC